MTTTTVRAGNPTFSLEAVSVNSEPLTDGPTLELTVRPGDLFTVELFMRDWSPDGQLLRAYQAALDLSSLASGDEGSIKPVDFDRTLEAGIENADNVFIDASRPDYVFAGRLQVPIAATLMEEYKFLAFLVDYDHSQASAQDGRKYYGGTINMQVSNDAAGTFQLRLVESPNASLLYDARQKLILPLDFEPLTVHVTSKVLRIVGSKPPNATVDVRLSTTGPDRLTLIFNDNVDAITAADFAVDDRTAEPPVVAEVTPDGKSVLIVLDRGLRPGRWTTITHRPSRSGVRIGFLPGDVDGNGGVDARDLLALIGKADEASTKSAGDEAAPSPTAADALRLIELLSADQAYRWRSTALQEKED